MAFNLFPKEVKFYDLFDRQNENLVASSEALAAIFAAFHDIAPQCSRISELERQGNILFRDVAKKLSLTFITPIDREDIHELSLAQESVLNAVTAISARIGLYGFAEVREAASQLTENLQDMVRQTSIMLSHFRNQKDVDVEAKHVETLKRDSDALLLLALGELYERETTALDDLLYIVKWSHVYDRIEEAITRADHLARVIEGISLKYS